MAKRRTYDRLEMERAGAGLRALRRRAAMTQEAAADAAGFSVQSWRNYESGARHMDRDLLARAVAAVDATPEDHALELSRMGKIAPEAAAGVGERSRSFALPVGGIAYGGTLRPNTFQENSEAELIDFAQFFAPGTRVLRLAGMSMVPYAEPGGFVTYNPRLPARRGQGCVIEMKDGSYAVKRFERMDETTLYVTELYPEERELELALGDVFGVYAIGLRGD